MKACTCPQYQETFLFSIHSAIIGNLLTSPRQTYAPHCVWFAEWTQNMMAGPQAGQQWFYTDSLREATTSFISSLQALTRRLAFLYDLSTLTH